MKSQFITAALGSLFLFVTALHAQVPPLINHQGRVVVGTTNFDGTGQFRFAFVDATGTNFFWRNSPDISPLDGVPDSPVSLPVAKGLYSVLLGETSITNMAAIPVSVFNNSEVFLRVWFSDGINGTQLLTPDQRITAVGYAMAAATAASVSGTVAASQITGGNLNGNLSLLSLTAAGQVCATTEDQIAIKGVEGGGGPATGNNIGVYGESLTLDGIGIFAAANNGENAIAIWGQAYNGLAGFFEGDVRVNGNLTVIPPDALDFGSQTRQMLNLWGTSYGIGVQANNTEYFRSAASFAWYAGGAHSDQSPYAGPGGQRLMVLTPGGLNVYGDGYFDGAVHINGTATVEILTIQGADVAEPFDIAEADLPKGTVVVIDEARRGGLKRSTTRYDTRVAGVVSGANGIRSGIVLSQSGVNEGGQNVAISGRVYALADASDGPIKPGDLLTSSDTPGHAMKVTDHVLAQGAIIGKAMSALDEGTGLVLVLVTLQ